MGDYSSVGLMFPASIAVGLAIGYFLDKQFDTAPLLLIIFTLYGVAAGFWNLFKITRTPKPTPPPNESSLHPGEENIKKNEKQ